MSELRQQAAPSDIVESLSCEIQQGGPLADLFLRAGVEQIEAAQVVLNYQQTEPAVLALVEEARYRITEELPQSPLQTSRQCATGCTACCHQVRVDVTPLEALVVADYLQQPGRKGLRDATVDRLIESIRRRRTMPAEERETKRTRCSMLGAGGLCAVYSARPLACAGAFSTSRSDCDALLAAGGQFDRPLPWDRSAKVWTMGISGGLQRALSEAGLDANLYELDSALLRALSTPNATARWLRGEDIFRGCLCTDAHSAPRASDTTFRGDRPAPTRPTQRRVASLAR